MLFLASGAKYYECAPKQTTGLSRPQRVLVVARLSMAARNVLTTPALRSRMIAIGFEPVALSSQDYRAPIDLEIAKWARVITAGNIKPE